MVKQISFSSKEYKKLQKQKKKPAIYRSKPADRTADGIVFESKAEMLRYQELRLLREAGQVLLVAHHPVFYIAGAKYTADFLVHWASGGITVEEVKSPRARLRPDWRRLLRTLRQLYEDQGIRVTVLER